MNDKHKEEFQKDLAKQINDIFKKSFKGIDPKLTEKVTKKILIRKIKGYNLN